MKVFSSEGTASPRKCASHTPSGSIDAAINAAASVRLGVDGAVIAYTSTRIVIHERSNTRMRGGPAQLFSIAMRNANMTITPRLTSVFVCGACRL